MIGEYFNGGGEDFLGRREGDLLGSAVEVPVEGGDIPDGNIVFA